VEALLAGGAPVPDTSTVLAAVPAEHAGMASAVNNDVARAASLITVAVLPAAAGLTGAAYLHPEYSAGFRTASLISAGMCIAGGAVAPWPSATPAGPDPRRPRHSCFTAAWIAPRPGRLPPQVTRLPVERNRARQPGKWPDGYPGRHR